MAAGIAPHFTWEPDARAALYRLVIESESGDALVQALLPRVTPAYDAPAWLSQRAAGRPVRWRVVIMDGDGSTIARSEWRTLRWAGS